MNRVGLGLVTEHLKFLKDGHKSTYSFVVVELVLKVYEEEGQFVFSPRVVSFPRVVSSPQVVSSFFSVSGSICKTRSFA